MTFPKGATPCHVHVIVTKALIIRRYRISARFPNLNIYILHHTNTFVAKKHPAHKKHQVQSAPHTDAHYNFPIKGFQWIFYIFGWIVGAGNLLFWAIMVILHFANNDKSFFGPQFHRRVYIWGIIMLILSVFMFFFMLVIMLAIFGSTVGQLSMM